MREETNLATVGVVGRRGSTGWEDLEMKARVFPFHRQLVLRAEEGHTGCLLLRTLTLVLAQPHPGVLLSLLLLPTYSSWMRPLQLLSE